MPPFTLRTNLMAEKIVLVPADMGRGLKIEGNKVVVDTDALSLPVDVHLSGVQLDEAGKRLTFEFQGAVEPVSVDVSRLFDTDTTVQELQLDGTVLKLINSDGEERTVDLAPLLTAIDARLTALENATQKLAEALPTTVTTLRNEVVAKSDLTEDLVSLGGVPLGRLVRPYGVAIDDGEL